MRPANPCHLLLDLLLDIDSRDRLTAVESQDVLEGEEVRWKKTAGGKHIERVWKAG
jgi:hypothetical protein